MRRTPWQSKLIKILFPVLRCFPLFPDTHSQSKAYMRIELSTYLFHASDFKVIDPSSYQLVEFLHLIGVADSPTPTCKFLHLFLELFHRFRVGSGFISFGK